MFFSAWAGDRETRIYPYSKIGSSFLEVPLRITSWNVNGLRAALKKGAAAWWQAEAPDVLCLQEVRAFPDQLPDDVRRALESDFAIWYPAERPGYSGVATFSRLEPLKVVRGLGEPRFDVEGRVIETRFPAFTLFNVYFPNGGRDHSRVPYKLDFFARLLEICDARRAAGEQVIVCGDFNIAHREIDLANPRENVNTTGFLPAERLWIDRYLKRGFVDAYRALYPERVQYTWWTYRFRARQRNIGWRIDYFLVSQGLMPLVRDVVVHHDVQGSDHCPVSLELDVKRA